MRKLHFALIFVLQIALSSASLFAAGASAPSESEKLRAILAAPLPDPKEHSKAALAKIYLERTTAAATLGDFDRERKEIAAAIEVIDRKSVV